MKIAEKFGHKNSERQFLPDNAWVLPSCRIGLEWEFEQATGLFKVINAARTGLLEMKNDGSLRDNGIEVTTTGDGLFGKDLLAAISTMAELCAIGGPVCNYRTAFHVHVDVRDMEAEELHNMLLLYALVEEPVFRFAGWHRYSSNFCVPWGRADNFLEILQGLQEPAKLSLSRMRALQRYSALNVQALSKFGTVEFRHMENVVGEITTKQVAFINLAMSLKAAGTYLYREKGLTGAALYEWAKEATGAQLMATVRYPLPTEKWNYPDALMLASQMVYFKPTSKLNEFNDLIFKAFYGRHPNWR
jgi:hypothetical protein